VLVALLLASLAGVASAQQAEPFGPVVGHAAPPERDGARAHVAGEELVVFAEAGDVLTVGTCGMDGARADGDTTLAVRSPGGVVVASNDDACGGLGSRIVYAVQEAGPHTIVLGCYSGDSCGGRVVFHLGPEELAEPELYVRGFFEGRALVGPDGQGLLADARFDLLLPTVGGVLFRLEGSPMGIAGGVGGGVLGGAVSLTAGFDLGFMAFGLGGGIATASRRPAGSSVRETGVFALHLRFGLVSEFHVEAAGLFALGDDDVVDGQFRARAALPIEMVEITAHGTYGLAGVWLGELGVIIWPDGPERRGVGIGVVAGGAAVFYQPICRFGLVCPETLYAGAHLGLGVHLRP